MEEYEPKPVEGLKYGVYKPKISFEEKLKLNGRLRSRFEGAFAELDERRARSRRAISTYLIATGRFFQFNLS